MLAHFVDSNILPHVDASIDLHTAGHSAECVPSTNMHYLPDPAMHEKTLAAAAAFGAPFNVVFWGVDEGATLTSSVERRKIVSLVTEIGGWGRVSVEGLRIGERGVRNMLKHLGMMPGKPETVQRDGSPRPVT
jgi:N-alpha-acetyl-L-2,4-diaminobutyrate deacetylase